MIDRSTETAGDTHCDSAIGKQYTEGPRVHYMAFEAYNSESPRLLRRLNTLRGLSHEQVEQVLTRGT